MSSLGKELNRASQAASYNIEKLLNNFFVEEKRELEPYVINEGHVNLILQTPEMSAVVVCWDEEQMTRYGHNHACEKVWTWVVEGELSASVKTAVDGGYEDVVTKNSCHFIDDTSDVRSHFFFGKPGSISVHIYLTEAMNICCHPIKCNCTTNAKVVLCNEELSVTDAERGQSVAKICEANANNAANICTQSLRLYTNFRDLIELLHNEINPLKDGEVHTPEHIEKICSLLGAVRLSKREYSRYLRFQEDAYTRNLVGYDVPVSLDGKTKAKFTVLILCWDKGQMSPIHDHAGSSCWVKVLKGQVREIRYDASVTPPVVKRDLTLHAEQVCYINDTQGVHAMGNPNPDQVAVSMHIYAPPYILCKLIDKDTGSSQVGSMATARIPSNPFSFVPVPGAVGDDTHRLELAEFYTRVNQSIQAGNHKEIVGGLLERLVFNESQWKEFVHFDKYRYTRSLVALDSNFSLMVLCWNKGHATPIHDHGPNVSSWVKVLSGNIELKRYTGTTTDASCVESLQFKEGESIDQDLFEVLHKLGNASDSEPAVSLHLYSPPFVQMGYTDSAGTERIIPVVHSATSAGRCCASNPISVCDEVIAKARSSSVDETKSETSTLGSITGDLKSSRLEDLLSFFQQEEDKNIFTNLNAIVRFVVIRDLSSCASCEQVARALNRMNINDAEWEEYISEDPASSSSSLIAKGKNFELHIIRWDPRTVTEPETPRHVSWIKVLRGSIMETQSLQGEQLHSGTITQDNVAFIGNKLSCKFKNVSDTTPCFALRLIRL